jgi:hypothetical protein
MACERVYIRGLEISCVVEGPFVLLLNQNGAYQIVHLQLMKSEKFQPLSMTNGSK